MEYGISLGSNQGRRLAFMRQARDFMGTMPATRIIIYSSVFETDPVEVEECYRDLLYLNAVVILDSLLPPEEMGQSLRSLEVRLGRERGSDRNAPRPLDADVIYADALQGRFGRLRLPHARWAERRFVVEPLAQCRPDLILPGQTATVEKIMAGLPAFPGGRLYSTDWKTEDEIYSA